jgi:hypothetical protein
VSGIPELSGLLHIRDEGRKDPGRCPGFPAGNLPENGSRSSGKTENKKAALRRHKRHGKLMNAIRKTKKK